MPLIIVLNCRVWDAALPLTVSESAFLHAVAVQNKIREIRKKLVIVRKAWRPVPIFVLVNIMIRVFFFSVRILIRIRLKILLNWIRILPKLKNSETKLMFVCFLTTILCKSNTTSFKGKAFLSNRTIKTSAVLGFNFVSNRRCCGIRSVRIRITGTGTLLDPNKLSGFNNKFVVKYVIQSGKVKRK